MFDSPYQRDSCHSLLVTESTSLSMKDVLLSRIQVTVNHRGGKRPNALVQLV